ncbi:MAG: glycosyltransferase family 2 protein [Alphaproteobacteria bacterium]
MVRDKEKVPVAVIIVTKNEEAHIARCLDALTSFAQVIVVDSESSDRTCEIAHIKGAQVCTYRWNGQYPKKRQWCLDTLDIGHDWIFWVDADEVVTPDVCNEISVLIENSPNECGFFVPGVYVCGNTPLKHGMRNNKIALFHRKKMCFPVVNDLDIDGMGEIEGHYQPTFKSDYTEGKIGSLRSALYHYAYEDLDAWHDRHERYAFWEAEMIRRERWPKDPIWWREQVKHYLRGSVLKPYIMFVYSYIIKAGFMDGRAGFDFALSRMKYCQMILNFLKKDEN